MTTILPVPFKGMEFRHNAWLEQDDKTPLLCRVTAVRKGTVYWKAVENGTVSGNSYYFDIGSAAKYVKSVVPNNPQSDTGEHTSPHAVAGVDADRDNLREIEGWAQDALNKLRRAHGNGAGCRLSADEVFALGLTRFGDLWAQSDPRTKLKGKNRTC